ncbi:MAG TPA: DNA recombination protein RmuC [Flavobacteriia bacterium]|nr:DNA recombination protein RmuC [Flavobacteriia bacterium]
MTNLQLYIILALILITVSFLIGKYLAKLKADKELASLQERINQKEISLSQIQDQAKSQLDSYKELVQQDKANQERFIADLTKEINHLRNEKENLQISLTQKQSNIENLQTNLEKNKSEIEELQTKFSKEFENLANKILEEKSSKFTKQNQENLKQILNPLQEKIQNFEEKVENTNKENIQRHAVLGQQLKQLHEQNIKISNEATNLTKALKGDSKTQGNWGELILERVLEKSGLEKGREYELEKSFTVNQEGKQRLRPDVIIKLPDNKRMVIDSKVSLTAYEKYVNADDIVKQEKYIKEHVTSLNRHINQLSEKKYEDLYQMESPDFVLLFIPIEPAFAVALKEDNQLYNKAFQKNIVVVTPSTLLATLRTIDSMWNNDKQQRNAIEIARQAGALYDKFEGLIIDLTKVGKKMDEAKNEYKGAMNKLFEGRGNLIGSVEKIKKLGAKAKKQLPESIINRAKNSND